MNNQNASSPRQPQATKRLYQFDDYTTTGGQPALSVKLDIRDFARFYAEDERVAGGYENDWHTGTSPYIHQAIHNADDALDALEAFEFPKAIKVQAQRAARSLTDVFTQIARLVRETDLTSGRLNRRRFTDIARESAAGTYDVTRVRPYQRTTSSPVRRPRIAVLASAGNAEMWGDAGYIPRVLELVLGIQWACEAADLESTAVLVKGHCHMEESRYREAVLGITLAAPGQTISPRTYGAALHRDLWRYGEMTCQQADYDSNKTLLKLQGHQPSARWCGYSFPCRNGGNAVNWARHTLDADIIISIGAISDKATADIRLDARFTLDQAVSDIAQQAPKLA